MSKKHKREAKKEPEAALVATTEPVEESAKETSWEWTVQREKALDMVFKGASQRAIAQELHVHYNTIGNWLKRPEFMQRLTELSGAQHAQVRLMRIQQTNTFTSRIAKLADTTLKNAEEHPNSAVAAEKAITWLEQFRGFREEERINSGENIQRHQITGMVGHVVAGARQASFKTFLQESIKSGAIDTDAIEATGDSAGDVITALVQAALRSGDLLDVITEEDRQQAIAEGEQQ